MTTQEKIINAIVMDIKEEKGVEEVSFMYILWYLSEVMEGKRELGIHVQNALKNDV